MGAGKVKCAFLKNALRFFALGGLCAAGWLAVSPAMAAPCGGATGTFSESRKDLSGAAPCTIDGYSRQGTTVTITVPVDRGTGSAKMICDGGPAAAALGGWVQSTGSAGECIYNVCYETGPSRPPVTVCEKISGGAISVSSVPKDLCPTTAPPPGYEYNTLKGFCVFDADSPRGISGTTGDDMLLIQPGAEAFFQSKNLPAGENVKWVEALPGTTRNLMMPSGPPTTYQDLKDFLAAPPAGLVAVEPACQAVAFDACTTPPEPPPVAGLCGTALGEYYAAAPSGGSLCYLGTASAVTGTETEWRWTCSGERGGPSSPLCTAYKPVNGVCGAANGKDYETAAKVNAGGLCSKGTASPASVSGEGPWSWQCKGAGGGTTASCKANKMETCTLYTNNLILVQDLSGSFGGDLPNMRSQMDALVNDPAFQTRKMGLTTFVDYPGCDSCTAGDYVYNKAMNMVQISTNKSALTSTINGWAAYNGGDFEESQWVAVKNAINDFGISPSNPATIILSTDADAHEGAGLGGTYPTASEMANLLKSKGAWLVALVPSGSTYYYNNFISSYGVKGVVVNIDSSSANFLAALKSGLTEICE